MFFNFFYIVILIYYIFGLVCYIWITKNKNKNIINTSSIIYNINNDFEQLLIDG